MNAQILERKLPPYSHLKRLVRQVARGAQGGSELLKQLMRSLANSDTKVGRANMAGGRGE